MANFADKFSGKVFSTQKNIASALAASSDNRVDGQFLQTQSADTALGNLPARIQPGGDQVKFFPELESQTGTAGIDTASIVRDPERKIQYIPLSLTSFLNNMVGQGSFISRSFTDTASYQKVSASLVAKFAGVADPDNVTVQYLVEENYSPTDTARAAAVIAPFTGALDIKTADGLTSSFSGIHNPRSNRSVPPYGFFNHFDLGNGNNNNALEHGVELMFDLRQSVSATHFEVRGTGIGDGSRDLIHNTLFKTSSLLFQNSASSTHSFATDKEHLVNGLSFIRNNSTNTIIASPAASGSPSISGSGNTAFSAGTIKNINGTNSNDGTYLAYEFKGRIAGDSDSGSLYQFFNFAKSGSAGQSLVNRGNIIMNGVEIVIYPTESVVTSSLFRFIPASASAHFSLSQAEASNSDVTGSSTLKTLFYISSSTTPGFFGLFTGSGDGTIAGSTGSQLGSLLHEDPLLQTTASHGLYSLVNNNSASFIVSTGSIDNEGANMGQSAMKVPRIMQTHKLL
jgi:hypothetical protein